LNDDALNYAANDSYAAQPTRRKLLRLYFDEFC
jgi:hypothetical protein